MKKRTESLNELQLAIRRYQQKVDALDEAAAVHLGINRSDLRCLDILLELGTTTPSHLATALGLTTGTITVMLDRLTKAGYLERGPDSDDRRRILVKPTEKIQNAAQKIYGPLAEAGEKDAAKLTLQEVTLITQFLNDGAERIEKRMAKLGR